MAGKEKDEHNSEIEKIIRDASKQLIDGEIGSLASQARAELSAIRIELEKNKPNLEEIEIAKADPLGKAIIIFEFADQLRSADAVNRYLRRTYMVITLAKRFPIHLADDRAIEIDADNIWMNAAEASYNGRGGNILDSDSLAYQWDSGYKFWVNKLANMTKLDVVSRFERPIKA